MSEFDERPGARAGEAAPRTIHRDTAPGKSPKHKADGAVDRALSRAGQGQPHSSGATFHDDGAAHAAADALGARAFTAGSDVYFGAGQYAPSTPAGQSLIQHELTHVQQSAGVARPEPGNFRVSSPGDPAEVAARGSASGATGTAATIYRDGETTPATTGAGPAAGEGSPGPGPGAGTGAGPAASPDASADPYEAWKAACNAFDTTSAVSRWSAVPAGDKARVAGEGGGFHRQVIHVMKKDSVQVIKEGGLSVADLAYYIFVQDDFADYLTPMRTHGLLNRFLDAEPLTTHLSPDHTTKLDSWVQAATNVTEAKRIFHKAYPTLHDSAPGPLPTSWTTVVAAWPLAKVKRMFTVLAQYLSPGHASTVSGGFVYVTTPGFGWWSPSQRRVFMPSSSESTGHSMTGGLGAGHKATDTTNAKGQVTSPTGRSVNPDYTAPDGTAKTGGAATMGHFTATLLHEVGHGVGDRLDGGRGNQYAENPSSWPGFNVGMDLGTWADELWVSGTSAVGSEPTVHRNAKLDESHAKDFLQTELGGGTYSPGWTSNPPRADMAAYVKWRYGNVPLTKWWDYFVERGIDKGGSYKWDDESARLRGGWCYAHLTRGGSGWTKFKAEAWRQKVSWYSLSSPREWFAEQYAHFYRTQKTGSGLDSTTFSLLKDLDSKEFVPTNADGSSGVTIGGGSAGEGISAAGSGETAAESAAADSGQAQDDAQPLFFPW